MWPYFRPSRANNEDETMHIHKCGLKTLKIYFPDLTKYRMLPDKQNLNRTCDSCTWDILKYTTPGHSHVQMGHWDFAVVYMGHSQNTISSTAVNETVE